MSHAVKYVLFSQILFIWLTLSTGNFDVYVRRMDNEHSEPAILTKDVGLMEKLDVICKSIESFGPTNYNFVFAVTDYFPEEEKYVKIFNYLREVKDEQRLIVVHVAMKEDCSLVVELMLPFFEKILKMEPRAVLLFHSNVCEPILDGAKLWQDLEERADVDDVKMDEIFAYCSEIPAQT